MVDLLVNVLSVSHKKDITNKEKSILETIVFKHICSELRKYFENESNSISESLIIKERSMADGQMIGRLVNDLLTNDEYSIPGLSTYTGYPEDVIYDLASGINRNPTIELANKIIELHFFARRELYLTFLKKIMM